MDNNEQNDNQDAQQGELFPEVPAALREVTPEKLAALRAKVAAFISGNKEGDTPAPEPSAGEPDVPQGVKQDGRVPTGADVDWSAYDLDFNIRHLYPQSELRETPQGVKWVVLLDEFASTVRSGKQHGKMVNAAGARDGQVEEPLNLGEYLTMVINGPGNWKIAAILPATGGDATVLLQRKMPYPLPDPRKLTTADEQEVDAPTDEELARAEAAGLAFAAGEGLEAPAVEEAAPETRLGEKTATIPQQLEGLLERVNLELNPGDPSVGTQDEAIVVGDDVPRNLGGLTLTEEGDRVRVVAPGIENIRAGLDNLLAGPDFGSL